MHSESIDVEETKSKVEEIIVRENELNFPISEIKLIKGEEKMKNIIRRKDGRWYGRKQIDGVLYSAYGKTQKECFQKLNKIVRKSKQKFDYPTDFYKFAVYWFDTYKRGNIIEKSERNYCNMIDNHFIKIHCDLTSDASVDVFQKFLNSLPPTRTREFCLMIMRQVLKKAYELDLLKKDIGQFLTKGKIQRKKISAFTLDEQRMILENLGDNEFSLIVYTFLLTGVRPNELETINKANIKKGMVQILGTKTSNARRWIKISSWLEEKLLARPNEIVFKGFNSETFRHQFMKFLNGLGIKGSVYMLRHTFATNLFYLGVPDKIRQSYMGHFSSVLTNDIYTDYDPTITKEDILNLYINLYPTF